MKNAAIHLALSFAMLAGATCAGAAQNMVGPRTPGYEDVVLLDAVTHTIVAGGEDGAAAQWLWAAWDDALNTNPIDSRTIGLTERVFKPFMPEQPTQANGFKRTEVNSVGMQRLLIKRKQDVLSAKRFMMVFPIQVLFDFNVKTATGGVVAVRDKLGNYVVKVKMPAATWVAGDGGKQFMNCTQPGQDSSWQSALAGRISQYCVSVPEWSGMKVPYGLLIADITKIPHIGESGDTAMASGSAMNKQTIRAGFIISPDGRSGAVNGTQGRHFTASEVVLFDVATMQVVAGPFDLRNKNPQVLYSTLNCPWERAGLLSIQKTAECDALNPTMPPRTVLEF